MHFFQKAKGTFISSSKTAFGDFSISINFWDLHTKYLKKFTLRVAEIISVF